MGADVDGHRTRWEDAHLRGIHEPKTAGPRRRAGAGSEPADLDPARDPDAHVPAFLARFVLFPAKLFVTGDLHRLVQRAFVRARVVDQAEVACVREFFDEVLAAESSRIHLERDGEQVDDPLYVVGSLRATSSAVWIRRHAIGEHTYGARSYVLPNISTARDQARHGLDGACQRHISTDVDVLSDL